MQKYYFLWKHKDKKQIKILTLLTRNEIAMFLERIIIRDFKNIESADISFSPKINCICGDNGEGKTNLLDAVYYLSMTKSFVSSGDKYALRHGSAELVLHGSYRRAGEQETVALSSKAAGEKTVKRNSKPYKRISDHIGRYPVVVVSPSDTSLIHDSGEERRRFINMMLSQTDPAYLRSVVSYNRLLKQRNSLLKDGNFQELLLDTISERMCPDAVYIYNKRSEASEMLDRITSEMYTRITGGKEAVSIKYRSDLSGRDAMGLFESGKARDRVMGFTTSGVQRDDFEFFMDGYPLRKCASQGQQKSFIVALKMAQYSVMKEVCGVSPVMLLDDLFDKLDNSRVRALIGLVLEDDFGQIFITDTDAGRLAEIVEDMTDTGRFYSMSGGVVTEEGRR